MERTLPPAKERITLSDQEVRFSISLSSQKQVAQLSEQAAAFELLQRLYLLSLEFTSVMGAMSRVAWKIRNNNEQPSDTGKQQSKADKQVRVVVRRLHENADIDFVESLMRRTDLKIDTSTNREVVMDKKNPLSLASMFYYDPYFDRALSIRLADTLVKLDMILARQIEVVNEKRRLLKQEKQLFAEQQNRRRRQIWPLRVAEWVKQYVMHEINAKDLAEMEVQHAAKDLSKTEQALRHELDNAFYRVILNEKTLTDEDFAEKRVHEYYQSFFGRSWRDSYTTDPDSELLVGPATVSDRVLFIARTQKLRRRLGLEETYDHEEYLIR